MEILSVPFSYLLKLELSSLAGDVITIVNKHNPEVLHIDTVFDMLLAQEPNIELLNNNYGAHPITINLPPLRKKCYRYAQEIVSRMNFVMKEQEDNPTDEVLNAHAVVRDYLFKLPSSKSQRVMLQKLKGFFEVVERDEAIETLFSEYHLTSDLNNLRSSFSRLKVLLLKRANSKYERSIVKTEELSASIVKALRDLFKQIEVAALKNTDLDYAPLVIELNSTIRTMKTEVNIRLANNKRKAQGLEVIEELEKVESNNESTSPEDESAPMMRSLNVETPMENGFKDGFEEKLDQKKTVASSVKNLQLPSVDNEA
jgi:hypothetical protein